MYIRKKLHVGYLTESWIRLCIYWEVNVLSYKERQVKKTALQYLMLSHSVFQWQFLFTYIFFASLKFGTCYITGQWGKFRVKNATLCLHILLQHFLLLLLFFLKEFCAFIIFISFSDDVSNFCNKILTNLKPELMIRYLLLRNVCITSKWNPHFDDYIKCKRPSQMMMF